MEYKKQKQNNQKKPKEDKGLLYGSIFILILAPILLMYISMIFPYLTIFGIDISIIISFSTFAIYGAIFYKLSKYEHIAKYSAVAIIFALYLTIQIFIPLFYSGFPVTISCSQIEYGAYDALKYNDTGNTWINFAGQSQFIPFPYNLIMPVSENMLVNHYTFPVHYEHGQNATVSSQAYYMHTWNCNFKVVEWNYINNSTS